MSEELAPYKLEKTEEQKHFSGLTNKEAWKLRRRVLYCILLFTAAVIIFLLRMDIDDLRDFHHRLVESMLTLNGLLLLYWFFGSLLDDNLTKIPWGKK